MSDNFNEIIKSKKPTLVDFYATWCGPCKMMEKPLEEIKSEVGDSVTILKVDVDSNRETAMKYNVRGVPTFILFKEGEIVWRQSGAMAKDLIKNKLNEFIQ
jgi:thioredoxin 1